MNVINKSKTDTPKAYTYLLKFNIDDKIKYYYGVRYGNVRHNRSPVNDIFVKYFSSSKYVKELLDDGIYPYEIIIHKTFNSNKSACEFEVKFQTKLQVKSRKDFLNQVSHFDNSLPNNLGRVMSARHRKQMSITSKKAQESTEYRNKRSQQMTSKWADPEYKNYMKDKYKDFKNSKEGKDFYKNRNNSFINKKHSEKTKQIMSIKAKENAKHRDFSKSAKKRPKYKCPLCNKIISSSNFKRHLMGSVHSLTEPECIKIITTIKNNIHL